MAVRAGNRWNPGIYEDRNALARAKSVSLTNWRFICRPTVQARSAEHAGVAAKWFLEDVA